MRNWKDNGEVLPLGFAGYKAGMTHIFVIDDRAKSPTKGEEIRVPVTIVECPDMRAAGLRLYSSDVYGSSVLFDVLADEFDDSLKRKIKLPKTVKSKLQAAEGKLERASDVRLLVYTQPKLTSLGKKKPEIFELAIGGTDVKSKFEFAKETIGKTLSVGDILKEGQFTDAHAVTTGRGFQGVVKRFGVKLKFHKTEKGRRRIGTLGPWTPKKTPWWVPMAGQMGYHTRTECNKQILKINDSKETPVTPNGGFLRYGGLKNKYLIVKGSIAGPKKRLILFTHARRKHPAESAPTVVSISKRSQQ